MVPARGSRPVVSFLLWTVVGALAATGVLALLTVGLFLLALAAVLGVLVLRRVGLGAGAAGVLVGVGLSLAWVGWLNRQGPGEVCHAIAHGTSCTTQWSPWPWYAAAAVSVVAGSALFGALSRTSAR